MMYFNIFINKVYFGLGAIFSLKRPLYGETLSVTDSLNLFAQ